MFEEKKHWRLSIPFRRFSGNQDPRPKSKVGQSGSRVSSVYLSDDTLKSGFIVTPEFDGSVPAQTAHEESNHTTHPPKLPVVISPNSMLPNGVDSFFYDLEPMGLHRGPYHGGGSCNIPVPNTNWDDDLSRRLGSAYEHIRSMPSTSQPTASLSSDPQMLRKQLGVPQHSVLNYPVHSSPDLPNPHVSPLESTSLKLSPAASPDVSYARTPKELGLCIKTNVYPISRCGLSDPFQPTQEQWVAAVPTQTENPPSQCPALEASCSAHFACTPRLQPSTTNPPKLAESHAEKPVTSPSLPSSRRQARRSVLRKPAPDTPLLTNTHRRQISLPQIRPPSPLKVNIPLHHTWHERRTKFDSLPECYSKKVQLHETEPRRTRESTEALASLAWTGTAPMTSSSYTTNRRRHLANPAYLPDRFSMSIAVEDDSISDDVLVGQLEKVHRMGEPSERGKGVLSPSSLGNANSSGAGGGENGHLHTSFPSSLSPTPAGLAKSCDPDAFPPSPVTTRDTTSDSEDAEVWQAARKALLCIREIVRTEKRYQEALKMLLNAQTATPPPPSMDRYISALVRVSEMLLKCFLEDPSAWGVSTAFVTSEDELEAAMVSWCAVAGTFFIDENDPHSVGFIGRWRHRRSGVMSSSSSAATKQMSISLGPRLPPMFPMISTPSKIKERMDEEYTTWQYPHNEHGRQTVSLHKPEDKNGQAPTGRPPSRKPSVRDLAIQPIQRVMRYVLLYRDLQDCTPPTSPSRLLVEHALEAAMRIANHCDGAQRNPAFFRAS